MWPTLYLDDYLLHSKQPLLQPSVCDHHPVPHHASRPFCHTRSMISTIPERTACNRIVIMITKNPAGVRAGNARKTSPVIIRYPGGSCLIFFVPLTALFVRNRVPSLRLKCSLISNIKKSSRPVSSVTTTMIMILMSLWYWPRLHDDQICDYPSIVSLHYKYKTLHYNLNNILQQSIYSTYISANL